MFVFVTYSRPVLPYKPQVVAEEGQNTDAEHGRHKKKKQNMEFGVSVWQLVLGKETGEVGEREINNKFTLILWKERKEKERKGQSDREMRRVSCGLHCMHIKTETMATMVRHCNTKGFGGWLGYLWAVLCRFPPAKL